MRERDIENYLVRQVKKAGGEVRKVSWVGRRGAPDRVAFLPAKKTISGLVFDAQPVWVELKAPGVKAEPHQLREHERMRALGQRVVVIDSFQQVDELLK